MIKNGFENEFDLDAYNRANKDLSIECTDDLYKLFLGFIENEQNIEEVLSENDKGISPVVSFINRNYQYFLSKLNSFGNDVKAIKRFKKTIKELWNYLFLRINKTLYKSKTMRKSANNLFLPHAPVYIQNNEKKMRVFVEGITFAARSMPYIDDYKNVVDRFAQYSDPIDDSKDSPYSSLMTYFVHHFFKSDEISIDKKACRFDGLNIEECKNSLASVFLLKKNFSIKEKDKNGQVTETKIFDKNTIISNLKTMIDFYIKKAKEIKNKYNEVYKDLKTNYEETKSIDDSFVVRYASIINNDFKEERFRLTNFFEKVTFNGDELENFDELSKIISDINDLCDAYKIIADNRFRVLVFLNKLGTISIVLIDYISFVSKWENSGYNCKTDNKLVEEAFKSSLKIENRNHSLSKIFNFINLNKIAGTVNGVNCILGLPFDQIRKENSETQNNILKQVHHNNNTAKAIFLRLTYNHKDIIAEDDSAMIYFDYLSLLVGHSHSYDKYTLWEYANHEESIFEEYKDKIEDMSSSRTSHIFYDDSLFTYSIVDQSPRFEQFNYLTNRVADYKNLQSHKHRLYSLWEFSSLCDSLIFGSSSMLIHSLLIWRLEKESKSASKLKTLSSQHRLSRVYAEMNLKLNHLVFNAKSRNFKLVNTVFEKIGLIDVEDKAKTIFDSNWQFANLNNNRFYERIKFYFTLASFFISLIAFAWAGAVFFDCKTSKRGGYDWDNLFGDLFNAHKFHFILVIAAIPLIVLAVLSIHDYRKNKRILKW